MTLSVSPGDLVYARGREWVALPPPSDNWIALRPLSGTEADIQLFCPVLERETIRPAVFALPSVEQVASQDAARLLSAALRMSLRRGAGPFRSAARLGFEPRAYQLVPLLMALRLPVVRLMIADDVGIGKTIEAGLIVRELMDRGEVERFSVLCPPHLVDQWTAELQSKFDIDATAVTAASAAKLERGLPASQTLFDAHPFTVVSLDYIKADKRRESFARTCPPLVVVDEAHACVGTHQGRQQRFELMKRLAEDAERHLLLLTATPHSGDENAYDRLLSLLDPDFSGASLEDESARVRLARHFVQRRRIDITSREWGDERVLPDHDTAEHPYNLSPEHRSFHTAVLDYCLGIVQSAGAELQQRRLAFWGTLALMRCVGSSPAAAVSALRNRLQAEADQLEQQIFDDSDDSDALDVEPASGMQGNDALKDLLQQAEQLTKRQDPKLEAAVHLLSPLIAAGANPVVFCRFIATAEHVALALKKHFPKLRIEAVTGLLTADERRERVESMTEAEQRLLVATDCLSEGINLQSLFDTVIHYDLSWNPTRHQQREGRVNRYGQPKSKVYSVLLYSPDSAIDGAVLDVILRKAETIRKATGVTVPLPEERGAVTSALMNAVLLRRGRADQLMFDFSLGEEAHSMETSWRNAEEGERRSRARYAQNAIKPQEVLPEWQRWRALLGGPDEVHNFVERAMSRFNAPLQFISNDVYRAHLSELPSSIAERLSARGLEGSTRIMFRGAAPAGTELVTRSHTLPAILAESLLESALQSSADSTAAIGRIGVWPTNSVELLTTVLLLRLRFKITAHGRKERLLLAEEAAAIAFQGDFITRFAEGDAALSLLDSTATTNLADVARTRLLTQALERTQVALPKSIADYARNRADALAKEHARVRAAGINVPRVSVEAVNPADVVGLFVLVPGGN